MSLALANNLPGMDAAVNTVENEYNYGPAFPWTCQGFVIDSASVDATNSPTTVLRRGLVMGQITSSLYVKQYDPAATDGSQVPIGILDTTTDMMDPRTAATRNKFAQVRTWGFIKNANLYGFDELARVQMRNRFYFDDYRAPAGQLVIAKTADYTVLTTDNGATFEANGAGAINFTLPAVGTRGLRFRFLNIVDQNMTITAPTGKLIIFNNAAATSGAFSTAGNKIGAGCEVFVTADGAKYILIPFGANTLTVA